MPRRILRRYLPNPDTLREHRALRPLGKLLQNPEIWHLHRRSVAGACFIGMFCAFLPIPAQMLVAGIAAVLMRCNLPISAALVWITNPVTVPPIFYFAYKLGAWLLGRQLEVVEIDLSFDWLAARLGEIWQPFLLGCIVCGWVSGVTLYVLVHVGWRVAVIHRWHKRRKHRSARATAHAGAIKVGASKDGASEDGASRPSPLSPSEAPPPG